VYHLSAVPVTCESVTHSHPSPAVGHGVVYSCQGLYNKLSYFCSSVCGEAKYEVFNQTRDVKPRSLYGILLYGAVNLRTVSKSVLPAFLCRAQETPNRSLYWITTQKSSPEHLACVYTLYSHAQNHPPC